MFFQLKELLSWLGLTVFEVWTALVCFCFFTVLLTLKVELESFSQVSWWTIFSPLFVSDAFNAYFCIIVFIRQYLKQSYKAAFIRALWSLLMLGLLFIFKYLLCQLLTDKSNGLKGLDCSKVLSPIFILLQFVMVRACQLQN